MWLNSSKQYLQKNFFLLYKNQKKILSTDILILSVECVFWTNYNDIYIYIC